MSIIGYLDLPCGLTGEMLLACLVDAGWDAGRLRIAIEKFVPAGVRWLFATENVMKGPLRATVVDLLVDEEAVAFDLASILASLDLPNRTASALGRGVTTLEAAAIVYAAATGLDEMRIERLYASASPQRDWLSTVVSQPTWDAAALAVLGEFAECVQPTIRLNRIGVGADQRVAPWPNVARLWLGTDDDVNDVSTR